MRTDTLFYRLFQAYPALALEAAGIVVDDPQGYQFFSEEVKETAFRLDGVLIAAYDAESATGVSGSADAGQ